MPHPKVSVAKDRTLPKGGERKGANEGGFHLFEAATRDHHGRSRRIEGGAGDTSSHRAPLARRSDCSLFLLQSAGCVGDRRRARQQCRRIHLRKRGRGNERERVRRSESATGFHCSFVFIFFFRLLLLRLSSLSVFSPCFKMADPDAVAKVRASSRGGLLSELPEADLRELIWNAEDDWWKRTTPASELFNRCNPSNRFLSLSLPCRPPGAVLASLFFTTGAQARRSLFRQTHERPNSKPLSWRKTRVEIGRSKTK
jgi:hypothetical protein